MLLAVVVAVCIASHAVALPETEPLPGKIYYDLEDAHNLFKEHVKAYERKYDVEEYSKRFEIFKENLKVINELNVEFPQTVFGVTDFSDLIPEEKQKYFGFKPPSPSLKKQENKFTLNLGSKAAPESFDWREHGAVTPIKNQWACGSCYIFSAIGNIEGQYAIKHKKLVTLSEQQCLDCLPNTTCAGGFMTDVYTKLTKRVGCMSEKDYPYLADDEQDCHEYVDQVVAKVTGGEILNFSNADELTQMVYDIGPLSVALDARDLQNYLVGILQPGRCSSNPDKANHAVLIVGYGVYHGEKYWIVKNSWGESTLEGGYFRIRRGVNACGIENVGFVSTAHVA